MDSPITLIIRAPNQRVEDQTVECMLGWTVKKLKQHLQIVYPNKPRETQQKLIYSGKLLSDEQTLKEVIRQGDDALHHTVHLVCLPGFDVPFESQRKERQTSPVPTSSSSSLSSSSSSSSEGLRYRGHTLPSSQADFVTTTVPSQSPVQTPPVMMPPGPDMAITPEQYMMMMQTYYYQMAAQYMQYYQTGVNPTPSATPVAEEQVPPPQNNAPNPAAPAANNNPVMNAQGGIVDDDDDDELGPRDWLDYVYTLSRFLVLVSIVYFYSNFTRFFAVCAFFFIVHLYQGGFFNLRRRQPQAQQQQQQQQQQQGEEAPRQENQQPNQQPQQPNDLQNNEQNETIQDQNTTNQEDTEPAAAAEDQAPPRPGILAVTWCFISTFFTSLIPAPPPPINAN